MVNEIKQRKLRWNTGQRFHQHSKMLNWMKVFVWKNFLTRNSQKLWDGLLNLEHKKSHYYINILTDLTGILIKEELSTLTTKKRVQEEKEKHEGNM